MHTIRTMHLHCLQCEKLLHKMQHWYWSVYVLCALFILNHKTLLDKTAYPYQAGDSLIIYNPVLLLSKPLHIWQHNKHNNELTESFSTKMLHIWSSICDFIQGYYKENINTIRGFWGKITMCYKIKLFLPRPQFECECGGKISENQSLFSKWPYPTTSETEHVWF